MGLPGDSLREDALGLQHGVHGLDALKYPPKNSSLIIRVLFVGSLIYRRVSREGAKSLQHPEGGGGRGGGGV